MLTPFYKCVKRMINLLCLYTPPFANILLQIFAMFNVTWIVKCVNTYL